MSEDQQRRNRGCLVMSGIGVVVTISGFEHRVAECRREVRVAGEALQDSRIEHLHSRVIDCLHSVGRAPPRPFDVAIQKPGYMHHKFFGPAIRWI